MGKQTKGWVKSQQAPLLFGCAFASGKDRQINRDKERGREGEGIKVALPNPGKRKDGSPIRLMKNEKHGRGKMQKSGRRETGNRVISKPFG